MEPLTVSNFDHYCLLEIIFKRFDSQDADPGKAKVLWMTVTLEDYPDIAHVEDPLYPRTFT